MKRALQMLTHKGMINSEPTCRAEGSNPFPLNNKI